MAHKYTVVGGVFIPHAFMKFGAFNGLFGCLGCYVLPKYYEKLPARLTSCMNGTLTLMAAHMAHELYSHNKAYAKMRAMTETDLAKMMARAGQYHMWDRSSLIASLILGAGSVAMATATSWQLYSHIMDVAPPSSDVHPPLATSTSYQSDK